MPEASASLPSFSLVLVGRWEIKNKTHLPNKRCNDDAQVDEPHCREPIQHVDTDAAVSRPEERNKTEGRGQGCDEGQWPQWDTQPYCRLEQRADAGEAVLPLADVTPARGRRGRKQTGWDSGSVAATWCFVTFP